MMERTEYNAPRVFRNPFVISTVIHALLILLILSTSYRYQQILKLKAFRDEARDISIDIAQEDEILQTEPGRDSGGKGPYGLNDEAGRELWESVRSRLTITPDNFTEFARIRGMRKGLSSPLTKKRDDSASFSTGIDHKLKTDFQDCYEDICAIVNLPKNKRASEEERSEGFAVAVLDYLSGKRAVRSWRTLWMVEKPAVLEDKIKLVRLLRRLNNYSLDGENEGFEYMRESIESVIRVIPDDLKFNTTRVK
jgi:hypothetical protein